LVYFINTFYFEVPQILRHFYINVMRKIFLYLLLPLLLASCGNNTKKVLVLTHDNPSINEDAGTVDCKTTRGHVEKELDFKGSSLKVSTAAGDATLSIPDKGYYIANLKNNDTIIGSYQHFSAQGAAQKVITQDDLKKKIDSLIQLSQGKNVSDANRNYFIPPNTVAKITSNPDAFIVAPYHQMTSIPQQGDKEPEVYQFYTINEVREMIANLQKLTTPEKSPNQ